MQACAASWAVLPGPSGRHDIRSAYIKPAQTRIVRPHDLIICCMLRAVDSNGLTSAARDITAWAIRVLGPVRRIRLRMYRRVSARTASRAALIISYDRSLRALGQTAESFFFERSGK